MARPSETGSRPTGQAPSGLGASRFDPARWMRKTGIKRDWVREGVTIDSAGMMARHYGAPADWGNPVEAFVWTKETWRDEWDCDSETKAAAFLFGNGRVVDIRFNARGTRTSFYSAPTPVSA